MTPTPDPRSVARDYVAAVQGGDEQRIRGLFAEDATRKLCAGDLPIAGTRAGRDAILGDFLATALAYYEPGSVQLEITGEIMDTLYARETAFGARG